MTKYITGNYIDPTAFENGNNISDLTELNPTLLQSPLFVESFRNLIYDTLTRIKTIKDPAMPRALFISYMKKFLPVGDKFIDEKIQLLWKICRENPSLLLDHNLHLFLIRNYTRIQDLCINYSFVLTSSGCKFDNHLHCKFLLSLASKNADYICSKLRESKIFAHLTSSEQAYPQRVLDVRRTLCKEHPYEFYFLGLLDQDNYNDLLSKLSALEDNSSHIAAIPENVSFYVDQKATGVKLGFFFNFLDSNLHFGFDTSPVKSRQVLGVHPLQPQDPVPTSSSSSSITKQPIPMTVQPSFKFKTITVNPNTIVIIFDLFLDGRSNTEGSLYLCNHQFECTNGTNINTSFLKILPCNESSEKFAQLSVASYPNEHAPFVFPMKSIINPTEFPNHIVLISKPSASTQFKNFDESFSYIKRFCYNLKLFKGQSPTERRTIIERRNSLVQGLFHQLRAIHSKGWYHRNLAPITLVLTESDGVETLSIGDIDYRYSFKFSDDFQNLEYVPPKNSNPHSKEYTLRDHELLFSVIETDKSHLRDLLEQNDFYGLAVSLCTLLDMERAEDSPSALDYISWTRAFFLKFFPGFNSLFFRH